MLLRTLVAASLLTGSALAQAPRPVLMISIDGMRPDYVTHADEHHLRIPHLRRFVAEGTYAEGVQGVFPTVTYPSHTALVTGVAPAVHGIVNNTRFDPERKLDGAWYWYAEQIKVPTLWSAVHATGRETASVGWPVTVDSHDIDDLIPEFWHGSTAANSTNPDELYLMHALSRPEGEMDRIAARTHTPYMAGNVTTLEGDRAKTVYAVDILRHHHPALMTVHLSSLDEEEHLHGPFSAEANETLEGLDAMVGDLAEAELAAAPDAVVVVVSDHGFAPVHQALHLLPAFVQAGLITLARPDSEASSVASWKAEPWMAGGLAAVVLHDPGDRATREQVRSLLQTLAADPANGIAGVLDEAQLKERGGFPQAAFAITLKPGFVTGGKLTGPLLGPTPVQGTHGYDPVTTPEVRAAFFAMGQGVAHGKQLGIIDMRQVAPTLAGILGVQLAGASGAALPLR